ncbi:ABC transporter substrate-binding protein [Microbacterium lacticum]
MKQRIIWATAGLAAAGLALSACSSGGTDDASGEKETISFLAPEYSDATKGYWEDLIAAFEEENPTITVELESIAWTDISTKINTLVSTGEEPDILNLDSYVSFAADDLLRPAEEALGEDTYDDLIPALRDNATYDGTVYGIPFIASARALFYNTALLDEAGVEPPTTWDELLDAATAVQEATGEIGYGLPMGSPEAYGEYSIWMWNNGGDWMTDGEWTINSPENVEALQAAADMYNAGVTQESPWSTNRDDLFRLFGEGKIGIIEGAAFLPAVLESQDSTIEYGIVPSPTNGDADSATLVVEDYLMVFKSSEHPEAASKFLQFFYAPENYTTFLMNEGMLPVTQSAADAMAEDPVAGPFLDLLSSAKFYPTTTPSWPAVSQEAVSKLGLAISGQESAQKVLDDLQTYAESQD